MLKPMPERTSARKVLPARQINNFVRGWVVWTKSPGPDPEPCYVGFGGAATLCDCKKNLARILSQTCFHAFSRAWNPPRIWNDLRTILIGLSCCLCSIVVIGQSRVRECWLQWNRDITNLYITKSTVKQTICFAITVTANYIGKNLDITKPRYIEHILPVPWPFDISRLHGFWLHNTEIKATL